MAGGCRKVDSTGRRNDTTGVVPPVRASASESTIAETDSGPAPSLTCGVTSASLLTDDGIGDLKPGRPASEVKRLCDVLSDSRQAGAGGRTERVLAVQAGTDVISATVADNKVRQLEINTPQFLTNDSLGVDAPLRRIARMRGAQFAPGEDGVYGFVAGHCGLSFRFSLPLRPPAGGEWTVAAIGRDHGDAAVDRVLVRKCG